MAHMFPLVVALSCAFVLSICLQTCQTANKRKEVTRREVLWQSRVNAQRENKDGRGMTKSPKSSQETVAHLCSRPRCLLDFSEGRKEPFTT
ncbi:hypothetical protein EDD18DRAFT_623894 [Armillaria luteobubalina]|uniref:Secreted protein n=1 Tax=Armillaria luteobubalina TaxID=153913 RepID=A0AA39QIX3_9AGAR|nr:hypothetical protein EDD18DRAFT_623894 [Armillaria luteobubalina]